MVRSPGPSLFPTSRAPSLFTSYSAVAVDDSSSGEHPTSFTDLLAKASSIAPMRNGQWPSISDPEMMDMHMERQSHDVGGSVLISDEAVPHSSSFSDGRLSSEMEGHHGSDAPHEGVDIS